ncbi:MAG TPA: hypothetical protein VFB08_09580 [Burkholderiales bacterium]|nr:hypothetical protein [Burkholderiales bacterium]
MNRWLALLVLVPLLASAQEKSETKELYGQFGSRGALLVLNATERPDGGWQVAGEYVLLDTLVRRFVEGERSPQLGVTTLKEGTSAILYGRPPTAELRGTWHEGVFRGTRYGPGGQERERFEFSERLPSMERYSAAVRCEAGGARYESSLAYVFEAGKLKPGSFEWRSRAGSAACAVSGLEQQPLSDGLRLAAGSCRVTLRELGDYVKIAAEHCEARCAAEGAFEPLLVDRRGQCRLLRPEIRQQ